MGQYVKIYTGEDRPANNGVVWRHHSVSGDASSPIVTQVYTGNEWVDVGVQQSEDNSVQPITHVLEILNLEDNGASVDDVLNNLRLDDEIPTLQQLRDIEISLTSVKYSDAIFPISKKTLSTNSVCIQTEYCDFDDELINGYVITVDENYDPAIYSIVNKMNAYGE